MKKSLVPFVLVAALASSTGTAQSQQTVDLNKLIGSYTDPDRRFATVRNLTIEKTKNGSIRIQGKLSGFPDDVDLGEATVQTYVHRDRGDWRLLLTFSGGRFKPFVEVGIPTVKPPSQLSVTCYLKGNAQPAEYFETTLTRDKEQK